jgi:hypothetical protein
LGEGLYPKAEDVRTSGGKHGVGIEVSFSGAGTVVAVDVAGFEAAVLLLDTEAGAAVLLDGDDSGRSMRRDLAGVLDD